MIFALTAKRLCIRLHHNAKWPGFFYARSRHRRVRHPFERDPDFGSLKPIAAKVPDFKSLKPVTPRAAPLNLKNPRRHGIAWSALPATTTCPSRLRPESTTKAALPSFVREDQERQYEQEAIAAAKPGLVGTIAKKLTLTRRMFRMR